MWTRPLCLRKAIRRFDLLKSEANIKHLQISNVYVVNDIRDEGKVVFRKNQVNSLTFLKGKMKTS